jgi:hypothetical protein
MQREKEEKWVLRSYAVMSVTNLSRSAIPIVKGDLNVLIAVIFFSGIKRG